jgi:hypothetical protein
MKSTRERGHGGNCRAFKKTRRAIADSIAAIKYGRVEVIRDNTGLVVDYRQESGASIPQFGNNDGRVDSIASNLVTGFMQKIRKHLAYRGATHTQSVLTITSRAVPAGIERLARHRQFSNGLVASFWNWAIISARNVASSPTTSPVISFSDLTSSVTVRTCSTSPASVAVLLAIAAVWLASVRT